MSQTHSPGTKNEPTAVARQSLPELAGVAMPSAPTTWNTRPRLRRRLDGRAPRRTAAKNPPNADDHGPQAEHVRDAESRMNRPCRRTAASTSLANRPCDDPERVDERKPPDTLHALSDRVGERSGKRVTVRRDRVSLDSSMWSGHR